MHMLLSRLKSPLLQVGLYVPILVFCFSLLPLRLYAENVQFSFSKKNGLVGENCSVNADCFKGLVCNQSKLLCDCPKLCKYKVTEGGCDCGKVDFRFGPMVVIVGIVLGLINCVLWFNFIRKTYRRLRTKRQNNKDDNLAQDEEEMQVVGEDIQPDQQYNRPDDNFEHKSLQFNDPPPAYSSAINNPNPIGFVNPVPVDLSTDSSSWAPSYLTPSQTQNQSPSLPNAILLKISPLPYPITSPAQNYNSSLSTNLPTGNESSLHYPISSNLPNLPSDNQNSKLPYSLVPPTKASAPDLNVT